MLWVLPLLCVVLPPHETKYVAELPSDFDLSSVTEIFQTTAHKHVYKCYVQPNQTKQTSDSPEQYLKRVIPRSRYNFTHTQYWYFEFIPFKRLSQWRYDNDKGIKGTANRVDNFLLGLETSDTEYQPIKNGFATEWPNGDICAVTNAPRKTRVELICDMSITSDGAVVAVAEMEYCSYLVRFNTPHVCAFPRITNETLTLITCVKSSWVRREWIYLNSNAAKKL